MANTAWQVIAHARTHLGYHESPMGSNRTVFGHWYGLDGEPWCDMFVSYVAAEANCTDIIGKFAYTPSHADWFRAQGRWGSKPYVGALSFYDFGLGRISHVGIVESVRSDGSIITIEGNTDVAGGRTGGQVMRKVRRSSIVGYGYPRYLPAGKPTAPAPSAKPAYGGHVLRVGSRGDAVRYLQSRIGTVADGVFGPNTERAVRLFQSRKHLQVDGEVGPQTWAAL